MEPIPDLAALMKIAQSPAGQKLLSMLQSSNGPQLQHIASTAAAGNLEEAKQTISSLLNSKEARDLLKQLENQL
jgi:hypothetical protein